MIKVLFLSAAILLLTGCVSDDIGQPNNVYNPNAKVIPGGFDYSTTSKVNLNVDYSACTPMGSVFFSVYSENPFKDDELDESIEPIFSSYTDIDGTYKQTVTLPAYATELYVYSGNFFVTNDVITAKVVDRTAVAVAKNTDVAEAPARRAARRSSEASGELTQSLETLYQLSYEVDWKTGEKQADKQVYKEWKTWLGSWDRLSGRPSYLMTPESTHYNELTFTAEEKKGIYQSITGAITRKETCPMIYRQSSDLVLTENSEVSVTLIGSNTCWNNSIGYYYYQEGQEPQNLMDINVIMLFPNTQDGFSEFVKKKGNRFYGNIALDRGDAVKLMYYPNIANGDMSGATAEFPAGTKIGFLLKSNGWGMQQSQGDKVFYNCYTGEIKNATMSRQYNCWSASTDGLSYCPSNAEQNKTDKGAVSIPNPDGVARTAKFAYQNEQGQQYAIVSFEDAANDEDYGDVILAMKPVGVFKMLPTVKPRVSTFTGVYAFEDMWPAKGDYDMNDAIVDYKEEREFSVLEYGGAYKVTKQTFSLTTYRNYVSRKNGLAVTLDTPVKPSRVTMKKMVHGTDLMVDANFTVDGNVYLLTDDMINEINDTYILELTYDTGINDGKAAKIKPFIYRDEEDGKRWEVHIPLEAPTAKMNFSYFGTYDDESDPENGLFYVRRGNYPFSFFLSNVTIDVFKNTILVGDMKKIDGNEGKPIDEFFPEFLGWSQSGGNKNKDWYKHPVNQ